MRAPGQDIEDELVKTIGSFRHDPLGFVQFAFPWGQPGTSLEKMLGPQMWQAEVLNDVRSTIHRPGQNIAGKGRFATASGKGIGKSAEVAWLCLWGLATFPDARIRLTAGTEPQLRSTTMPEVAKWFNLMICKHWFHFTATSIYARDPEHEKTWRLDAMPWNAANPEAFAGLHNLGKRIVFIMDEASQIADPIYDTTDGIMSDEDTEVIWACFGNPTRGTGRFREAATDPRWKFRSIDSRTVTVTDKKELNELVDKLGEDSDYVRVNVRGLFPRVSSMQFISNDIVIQARKNHPLSFLSDPLILGVDVARFGDDNSVLCPRKGRDARTIPWKILSGHDTVEVSNAVAAMHEQYRFDAIHVDGGGVGGGVVDILRRMNVPVREVQFGGKADRAQTNVDGALYANKRTEMWGLMREALPTLAIPDDPKLEKELVAQLYGHRNDKEIQLVSKEIMKRQHKVDSPDMSDALALTFAYPVQPLGDGKKGGGPYNGDGQRKAKTEYDPFAVADA
jgi:hypothetical protein